MTLPGLLAENERLKGDIETVLQPGDTQAWAKVNSDIADAVFALSTPANPWRPTHQHVKRGTEYRVLGMAEFQNAMDADMPEGVHIVFYQATDGKLWAREHREFDDGRFVPLPTPEEDR